MGVRFSHGRPLNMTPNLTRRVVCAANRCEDTTLVGPRHWDSTMHAQYSQLSALRDMRPSYGFEQGFLNSWGEFLTRKEAWLVASHNNQIIRTVGNQSKGDIGVEGVELYSENLY